jgi:hypothetical protein
MTAESQQQQLALLQQQQQQYMQQHQAHMQQQQAHMQQMQAQLGAARMAPMPQDVYFYYPEPQVSGQWPQVTSTASAFGKATFPYN